MRDFDKLSWVKWLLKLTMMDYMQLRHILVKDTDTVTGGHEDQTIDPSVTGQPR